MNDEIVFLGTGGGRYHVRTQHRATGGILFKVNGVQAHIDPGPGATVRINQYNEDPLKTELFIVTHSHIDHYNDLCAIIESSRKNFHDKSYNYYKKGVLITTKDILKYIPQYHLNMLQKIIEFKPGDIYHHDNNITIIGTRVQHAKVRGFGVKFILENYSIAFTSDTIVFPGFSEQYNNVNILVLNLLRPNNITCKQHLCTDQVLPYLNKINPPLDCLIITHFGSYMDGPRTNENRVPSQVKKFRQFTNIKKVIAAEDGFKLKIKELLEN
ncbi:MAG: MBL fold metallo-hydrolase [Promethearchaeota archaeon]